MKRYFSRLLSHQHPLLRRGLGRLSGLWRPLLRWLLCLLAFVLLLSVGAFFVLNSTAFQNRVLQQAAQMLSDRLLTRVTIDHVNIGFLTQDVRLYGLDVEDRQHRKMLQMDTLSADLRLLRLLQGEVSIRSVRVKGLRALLLKPSGDSAANYQFVIDAFRKEPSADAAPLDSARSKRKLTLAVERGELEHVAVSYNDQHYRLQRLEYRLRQADHHTVAVEHLSRRWVSHTKKGDVDNLLDIGQLAAVYSPAEKQVTLSEARFATDNHQPRKNHGKPHRGAFDAGHLDLLAALQVDIAHADKDSVVAILRSCRAEDCGSGLLVSDLTMRAHVADGIARLRDFRVKMQNTQLRFDTASVQLPSKKTGRRLAFQTSPISGRVVLRDISRPFSPALANFTLPLRLRTTFNGTDEQLHFGGVSVVTDDKKLSIRAHGSITGLRDSRQLAVRFHVDRMTAQAGSKERIISQFPVKKFMMKQLHNLGTIHYRGDFAVLWKREQFEGLLQTACGDARFRFHLDEQNKYVVGNVRTDSFMLGRAMDMPDIGKVVCQASFRFDISKPRTARMRREKGGKLPIGQVDAEVTEARYKKLRVRNTVAHIRSNGAVATGDLAVRGKRMDVMCTFSFTNTSEMRKMKVKPGLKFHDLSDADKAAKAEKRVQRNAEKEARKAEKAARQAAKAEEKAARKAEKQAERAVRKAEKQAEKAARKAARRAEKEARKAADRE